MANGRTPPPSPRAATLGLGVDATGGPVIDPTANVIALTEAEARRQDDLREAHAKLVAAELACLKEIGNIRAQHASDLAGKESARLDAIRQVDQLNVSTAASASAAAIHALAATTTTNAENLRTALANTAQTIANQTSDTAAAINMRLAALEKAQYEGQGKSGGIGMFGAGLIAIVMTVIAAGALAVAVWR